MPEEEFSLFSLTKHMKIQPKTKDQSQKRQNWRCCAIKWGRVIVFAFCTIPVVVDNPCELCTLFKSWSGPRHLWASCTWEIQAGFNTKLCRFSYYCWPSLSCVVMCYANRSSCQASLGGANIHLHLCMTSTCRLQTQLLLPTGRAFNAIKPFFS